MEVVIIWVPCLVFEYSSWIMHQFCMHWFLWEEWRDSHWLASVSCQNYRHKIRCFFHDRPDRYRIYPAAALPLSLPFALPLAPLAPLAPLRFYCLLHKCKNRSEAYSSRWCHHLHGNRPAIKGMTNRCCSLSCNNYPPLVAHLRLPPAPGIHQWSRD